MATNTLTIPMRIQTEGQVVNSAIDHFIGSINIDFTADAEKLPNGSQPIVTYNNKHFHFGIPNGDKGNTGNGISSTALNSNYTLTLRYTDGTSYTTPSIRGPQGAQGIQGIQGIKGDKGNTGNGISSINKTSTSGLVDTYTIAMTDASTSTFDVTNGYSPTATVVKNNGVATITITDKNGTTTTTIADGANVPGSITTNTIESILDGSYVPN